MRKWPEPTMIATITLIAIAPATCLAGFAFNRFIPDGTIIFAIETIGIVAAVFSRPRWRASLIAAGIATIVGAVAMFGASRFYDWNYMPAKADLRRMELQVSEQNRQEVEFLRKGDLALKAGHPLVAPEGGYLLPYRTAELQRVPTTLRFISTDDRSQLAAWSQERRSAEARLANKSPFFEAPSVQTMLPITLGHLGLLAFGLALGSNLVATIAIKLRRTV